MGAMKARVVAAREAADEARREDDELLNDVAWDETQRRHRQSDGATMSEGRTLPPFPVNEETTTALRHALATSIGYDDAGNRIKEGGDFTLLELLDFYSGSDETRATYVGTGELIPGVEAPIYEMWDQHYSPEDVIRALLDALEAG